MELDKATIKIRVFLFCFVLFLPFPWQDYFGLRAAPPAEAEEFSSAFLRFIEEENSIVLQLLVALLQCRFTPPCTPH